MDTVAMLVAAVAALFGVVLAGVKWLAARYVAKEAESKELRDNEAKEAAARDAAQAAERAQLLDVIKANTAAITLMVKGVEANTAAVEALRGEILRGQRESIPTNPGMRAVPPDGGR